MPTSYALLRAKPRRRSLSCLPSGVLRVGLALLGATTTAGCMGQSSTNATGETQIPVTTSVPLGSNTNNAISANAITAGPTAGTGVPAALTISPTQAPDLCFSANANSVDGTPFGLRACDGSNGQLFVWNAGMLQSALGNCLQLSSSADANAPVTQLVACNTNSTTQHVYRFVGDLTVPLTSNFVLSTPSMPTTASSVSFVLSANQQYAGWELGNRTHDGNGALVDAGASITLADSTSQCFGVVNGAPSITTCASGNANQGWRFLDNGAISNQNVCLEADGSAVAMQPCSANGNQIWSYTMGLIKQRNSGYCLDTNQNAISAQVCSAATRTFYVGYAH